MEVHKQFCEGMDAVSYAGREERMMKVLLKVFNGKVELMDYEKEFERIYGEGLNDGRKEGYMDGYFAGKRDGEMSKKDIPEEVKKHLEEALSWLN